MKKYILILFFLLVSATCSAQFLGIGAQYANAKDRGNDIQFAANIAFPYWHKPNKLNMFITGGIDYTGGASPVSGLNIKPISINTFLSESLFNNNKFTLMVGCDGGYLFNFRNGTDGVVVTPNLYFDYKIFFLKTGYDMNLTGGEKQFFVRLGVGFTMGSMKMFAPTKIW